MLQLEEEQSSPTIIKVVGVGGAGMNAVGRMIDASLKGVDFIVINTDEQVLRQSAAEHRIAIGQKTTRGMGAGGDPDIGLKAAMEDRDRLMQELKGADMVFITAGMGGGTGTGAAPVIAQVARELGALTVGVVTMPFEMEGGKRMDLARQGLEALRDKVDTLITIRNDSIFKIIDRVTPVDVAFRLVDEILLNAVKGISDLINTAGVVNVDFADVRAIMGETGDAIMGAGEGTGENRTQEAVNQAIHNALLEETSIAGATALLINVCGGEDMSITEWKEVSEMITGQVDPRANIIIGLTIDKSLRDRLRVTVIATGFPTAGSMDALQRQAAGAEGTSLWTSYETERRAPGGNTVRQPVVSIRQGGGVPGPGGETGAMGDYQEPGYLRAGQTGAQAAMPAHRNQAGGRPAAATRGPRTNQGAAGQPGSRRPAQIPSPQANAGYEQAEYLEEVEAHPGMPAGGYAPGVEEEFQLERPENLKEIDSDDLEIPAYLRRKRC